MKVRKILDGDYCFGHGNREFLSNTPEAVAQCVMTRLALWQGTWFLNSESGTPWLQGILMKNEYAEAVIRARILETEGVVEITDYQSIVDPDTRTLSVTVTIDTLYGETTVTGVNINGD